MKFSPQDIADLIYKAELAEAETAEDKAKVKKRDLSKQASIITFNEDRPMLVNAGAGSGKTETMTQRILWLVINHVAKPEEILGLTFTRKAAGELSARIRKRFHQLRRDPEAAKALAGLELAVEVSTYHAYAGRVLKEYGILDGIETEVDPIGEAQEWQIAQRIVSEVLTTEFPITDKPDTVIERVLSLASQIQEHDADIESIRTRDLSLLEKLNALGKPTNADTRQFLKVLQDRLSALPMVETLLAERKRNATLTFDDHMAMAASLVEKQPEIGIRERARFSQVILDEYQDTSVSQVRFLRALYGTGTHKVTAVGDPNQSIYGWRGAAQGTLQNFAEDFNAKNSCNIEGLMTSWRSDQAILNLANNLLGGSDWQPPHDSKMNLAPRPGIGPGEVAVGRYFTIQEEAQAIAEYFKEPFNSRDKSDPDTFAVLVRTKSQIPEIQSALIEAGLPVEVIGLGGLMQTPEVADLIALLRTLLLPDSGTALMRLLAGPRLALGAADIRALGQYSRELTKKQAQSKSKRLELLLETESANSSEADDFTAGSIIDALDQIDSADKSKFSPVGYVRLQKFASELAELRTHLRGSIIDAIIEAERFLRLDVEVLTRYGIAQGRKNLDAFLDEAATFERTGGTLLSFLEWLRVADKEEGGLRPVSVAPSKEAIQILTIHTSKGSEWDYVAIPGVNADTFPNKGKKSDSWLRNSGAIPAELRRDNIEIPPFVFPDVASEKSPFTRLAEKLETYNDFWKARRFQEEYRLGYVAFTRAAKNLLITSHIFAFGKREKGISPLFAIAERNKTRELVMANNDDKVENPNLENPREIVWPHLSPRAQLIKESADFVRAQQGEPVATNEYQQGLLRDAKLLIRELTQEKADPTVYLPSRLSVSALIKLKRDPEEFAYSIRRPMPTPADTYARRGTDFHSWIETHLEIKKNQLQILDDDANEGRSENKSDVMLNKDALEKLKVQWLSSEWAARKPISVEEGFETVVEGVLLRGRIDAIYEVDGKIEVVDWKTGSEKTGEDLADASIQLAMYRLAYSKLHGVPLEKISAAFYYIPSNKTVRPVDLLDEAGLTALIAQIPLI